MSRGSPSAPPYTDAERYLVRYAEPEAQRVAQALSQGWLPRGRAWERALVVPVMGERATFLSGYDAALSAAPGRSLVLIVVNAHEHTPDALLRANADLVRELGASFEVSGVLEGEPKITLHRGARADVLLIERWEGSSRLDARQGVGLARKLGNDVALALWAAGHLRSPWLYQTDADATLPVDAFSREQPEIDGAGFHGAGFHGAGFHGAGAEQGARLFAFRHTWSAETQAAVRLATLQYEVLLRYHVLGLLWAQSPYAYHALGSCIAVHARSYVAVRGFPKRAAGEDFYLLQKVCKLAPVKRWPGAPVLLEARASQRAPFGTGPRVHALLNGDTLRLESGTHYELLRQWLRRIAAFAAARDARILDEPWDDHGHPTAACGAEQTLIALGARQRLTTLLRETSTSADLLARAHTWFDGLKTQRFLHALRVWCPELPAFDALSTAPFTREWAPALLDAAQGSVEQEVERWQRLSEVLAQRGAE